jgi:hypothetical protein
MGLFTNRSSAPRPATSDTLRCSFCNKSKDEVKKLIAGPAVFICDECVEACVQILKQEASSSAAESPQQPQPDLANSVIGRERLACRLCGEAKPVAAMLHIPERGPVCGACADAVETVLASGDATDPALPRR